MPPRMSAATFESWSDQARPGAGALLDAHARGRRRHAGPHQGGAVRADRDAAGLPRAGSRSGHGRASTCASTGDPRREQVAAAHRLGRIGRFSASCRGSEAAAGLMFVRGRDDVLDRAGARLETTFWAVEVDRLHRILGLGRSPPGACRLGAARARGWCGRRRARGCLSGSGRAASSGWETIPSSTAPSSGAGWMRAGRPGLGDEGLAAPAGAVRAGARGGRARARRGGPRAGGRAGRPRATLPLRSGW